MKKVENSLMEFGRDSDRRDTRRGQVAGRHSRHAQGISAHLHGSVKYAGGIIAHLTEQVRPGINLKMGRTRHGFLASIGCCVPETGIGL